jgi:mannopine transport system permease protein
MAGDMSSVTTVGRSALELVASRLGTWLLWVTVGGVLLFLIVPTLIVVPISFGAADHLEFPPRALSLRWYEAYLQDPGWTGPTVFSFQIAIVVTLVATLVGTMAALALVRGGLRGRAVLNAVIIAPLIVPVIIYAIAALFWFGPAGWTGTLHGFVLAHSVMAAPYVVLIVSAALYRVDPALELAAMSLGASRTRAVLAVTLPLAIPAVIGGAVFAFLASFDDATVSFFISGIRDKSLPRKMFENVEFSVSPVVAVVSTLITVLTLALISLARLAQMRGPKASLSLLDEPETEEGADDWVAA